MSSITWLVVLVGLVQLPIACDVLHHAFPGSRIPRLAASATRPMFRIMSAACAIAALYLFFMAFLPLQIHQQAVERTNYEANNHSADQPNIVTKKSIGDIVCAICLSILAVYIVSTMMWHYCVASGGAESPIQFDSQIHNQSSNQSVKHTVKRCEKCNAAKYHRVHHCRTCDRCCVLFDHHCPFTASCIGESNFRSFWLWLTVCTIGLTYSCALSFQSFNKCILHRSSLPKLEHTLRFQDTLNWMYDTSSDQSHYQSINQPFWTLEYCRSMGNLPWTFLCVAFGLASVALLWAAQTWLVSRQMTTMEWIVGIGKRVNIHHDEDGHNDDDVEECANNDHDHPVHNQSTHQLVNQSFQRNRTRRKSWSLIHRHESLHRTMLPDAAWNVIDRYLGGRSESAKRSQSP